MQKETQNELIQLIFLEFGIQEEYIKKSSEINNLFTYVLKDEDGTEAVLSINFNTMKYSIDCEGYVEEKEIIILRN